MPEEKIFPNAPSNPIYVIIIIGVAASTLYLDFLAGRTSNPIIFFIATVVVPIIVIAIANNVEGTKFVEFLGLFGSPLFAISMILLSAGVTGLVFYAFIRPASILVIGTSLYKSINIMFLPLSSKPFWFLAYSPVFGLIFYSAVAVGEELIKCVSFKIISNWLYEHIPSKNLVILVGFVLSILLWILLHFISWGTIFDPFGFLFGLILSFIFIAPYLLLGENLISPEYGVEMSKFSLFAPIGGHFFYNFVLSMGIEGVAIAMSQGLIISGALAGFGLLLLAICYIRKGIPIFGHIRI